MKTLYLECHMGASGDMLMASLLELHPDPIGFIQSLNAIGIPGVHVSASPSTKCGIVGTHISVKIYGIEEKSTDVTHNHHTHDHGDHAHHEDHHHPHDAHDHHHDHEHHSHDNHSKSHSHDHVGMTQIQALIHNLPLSPKVKEDALGVYQLIALAESHAHGKPVDQIHFHEVGNSDAIADIVGVCLLIESLAPDNITASPIHVGSGQVRCAHGILPIPAPATAHILRNIPIYSTDVKGELCTPTGAALLKHFVSDFGPMSPMSVAAIGYGMGTKDFTSANCLRAFIGSGSELSSTITELSCNLDDMTPEAIGFALERLFEKGALDVYTQPIGMKKNRPGIRLTCLCPPQIAEIMTIQIFKHTSTLGIREQILKRHTLERQHYQIETDLGTIRMKKSSGYGITRTKPEYDDIAQIAKDSDLSITDVLMHIKE